MNFRMQESGSSLMLQISHLLAGILKDFGLLTISNKSIPTWMNEIMRLLLSLTLMQPQMGRIIVSRVIMRRLFDIYGDEIKFPN